MSQTNKHVRNDMPTKAVILTYWIKNIPSELDDGQLINGQCFACMSSNKLERAHIKAISQGGDNSASNLHILCASCHLESEFISGETYWAWYRQKIWNEPSSLIKFMSLANAILTTCPNIGEMTKDEIKRLIANNSDVA